MTIYRYALQSAAGPNEDLGTIDIISDQEAITFGQDVVDDILLEYEPARDGMTLEIRDGVRLVGSVPMTVEMPLKAAG
ncbi:MAG: hypothetical protein Q7T81_05000 [Pseudolabrys sp.]|nr:hypothetical protein [Pseudolabrys sp.]